MKKISLFLIIGFLMISLASAFDINKGANVYFNCNNATSGVLLGTVANMSCWNSVGTAFILTDGMTNILEGTFNYTFDNLTSDTYSCFINCSDDCVDYFVPVKVGYASDANITDIKTQLTTIETDTDDIQGNQDWNVWDDGTRTLTTADWTTDSDLTPLATRVGVSNLGTNISNAIIVNTSSIKSTIGGQITNLGTNVSTMIITNTSNINTNLLNTNQSIMGQIDVILSGIILNTTDINTNIDAVAGEVDTLINESHGEGLYNMSGAAATSAELLATNESIQDKLDTIAGYIDTEIGDLATTAQLLDTNESIQAKLDTIDNYIDTEIASILAGMITNTSQLQTDLTNTNQSIMAQISIILSGMITNTSFINTNVDNVTDEVWDEVLTGATHNIPTSAGRRLRQLELGMIIHTGTAQAGGTNYITLDSTADGNDSLYVGNLIILVEGTGIGQVRQIHEYNGTTKNATTHQDWIVIPDTSTEFEIVLGVTTDVHYFSEEAGENISLIYNTINEVLSGMIINTSTIISDTTNILANQSIIKAVIDTILSNQTTIYNKIANIWSEATRTITDFNFFVGLNTTVGNVWSFGERNLSTFDFRVRLNTTGIDDITSNITSDHGTGLYNASATISSADKTEIAELVWNDTVVNEDNRTVGVNVSASISTGDKKDIGKYVTQYMFNRTETFYNDSNGYPTNTTIIWITDNRTANVTYGYYADNITIYNASYIN